MEHKTVEPTRNLPYLGIQMDTVTHVDSISVEKLKAYRKSVRELSEEPGCSLRELKSLIGKL